MNKLKEKALKTQTLLKLSEGAGTLWVRLPDAEEAVRAARLQALMDAAGDVCHACCDGAPVFVHDRWRHGTEGLCQAQMIHERIKREGLDG